MRIYQNISAMNTHSRLTSANASKGKSLEKLSSGLRINRAGDDAAGLAISETMRAQVGGLKQAMRNAQDGISLIQTAEGALTETHAILNRMRELAVQAINDTNTAKERGNIQLELNELADEIDTLAERTEFNEKKLLTGLYAKGKKELVFQIGANDGQTMKLNIDAMNMKELFGEANEEIDELKDIDVIDGKMVGDDGNETDRKITVTGALNKNLNVVGKNNEATAVAENIIENIDKAIDKVSTQRAKLGAAQNRLEHTVNNLTATSENLSAAESRVRDVDMAEEMMEFTKNNILAQASTAMLAQANQMPGAVLQLLQ